MYPARFPAWSIDPPTGGCGQIGSRLREYAGKIYRRDKMTANFSRFSFPIRYWRTVAGSAD
jgi:hypothetical protein